MQMSFLKCLKKTISNKSFFHQTTTAAAATTTTNMTTTLFKNTKLGNRTSRKRSKRDVLKKSLKDSFCSKLKLFFRI
jgi:hypothetical protein